jgi:hypothetical protein
MLTRAERARADSQLSGEDLRRMEADDLQSLLAATNAKRRARGKEELTHDGLVDDLLDEERARRPPKGSPNRWDGI